MMNEDQVMTLSIPHEKLEDIVISHLYATGAISDEQEVLAIDFGLEVDENGMTQLDVYFDENDEGGGEDDSDTSYMDEWAKAPDFRYEDQLGLPLN